MIEFEQITLTLQERLDERRAQIRTRIRPLLERHAKLIEEHILLSQSRKSQDNPALMILGTGLLGMSLGTTLWLLTLQQPAGATQTKTEILELVCAQPHRSGGLDYYNVPHIDVIKNLERFKPGEVSVVSVDSAGQVRESGVFNKATPKITHFNPNLFPEAEGVEVQVRQGSVNFQQAQAGQGEILARVKVEKKACKEM